MKVSKGVVSVMDSAPFAVFTRFGLSCALKAQSVCIQNVAYIKVD